MRGAASRHPRRARELGIDAEEMSRWRDAAEAMYLPYDETLGVHPQAEGLTSHQIWDFAATTPEQYPLLRDGLHMAALAGSWIALVACLAGMRDRDGTLSFVPRLPEEFVPARIQDLPAAPGAGRGRAGSDRHRHPARR